jgi:hypothetical protein
VVLQNYPLFYFWELSLVKEQKLARLPPKGFYFHENILMVEAEGIEPSSEVRPAIRASTGLASAFL